MEPHPALAPTPCTSDIAVLGLGLGIGLQHGTGLENKWQGSPIWLTPDVQFWELPAQGSMEHFIEEQKQH